MESTWEELRQPSIEERIRLAQQLRDSIVEDGWEPPLSAEVKAELDRRWDEFEKDPTTYSWSEVRGRSDLGE